MPKFIVEFTDESYDDLKNGLQMITENDDGTATFECSSIPDHSGRYVKLKLTPVTNPPNPPVMSAYRVEWIEHERGWGQRHVSYSYYLSEEEALEANKKYNDSLPSREELGGVPECYITPESPELVEVDLETYQNLVNDSITSKEPGWY